MVEGAVPELTRLRALTVSEHTITESLTCFTEGLATEVPEVKIREWVYSKNNPYRTADVVEATPINWAVPTVQRLWFG